MVEFKCFFCILGIFFSQVCLIYSSCTVRNEASGNISDTYIVQTTYEPVHSRCWKIENPDRYPFHIELSSLTLYTMPKSSGYLNITFEDKSKFFEYWSESRVDNFTTTSFYILIEFVVVPHMRRMDLRTGFTLHFKLICDKIYTEATANISSPSYPNNYPPYAQCIYGIQLPPGYLINITFYDMDIGIDNTCTTDYLQVHDGENESSPLLKQFCGIFASFAPYSIISTQNNLWMKFESRYKNRGFFASYNAVKMDADLGKHDAMKTGHKHEENLLASSVEDDLESKIKEQKLSPCVIGFKEFMGKDFVEMEAKEHERRIEILELQKKYEVDRIEFQKMFENKRLEKIRLETEMLQNQVAD